MDTEGLALAEVLLGVMTAELEDTELTVELWLAEMLDDEALDALLETAEELVTLLDSEDDAEGLMLDEKA